MHITFWLKPPGQDRTIHLPTANLHIFQAMLYSLLPPEEAAFLHDTGYEADGKKLKLFAMSWPVASSMPLFEEEGREKKMIFPTPVRLTVSTPMYHMAMSLIDGALSKGELRAGNNPVQCIRVEAERQIAGRDTITVRTLSPVTCYETVSLRGHPYTIFFKPDEKEFQRSTHKNLLHKFRALYPDREPPQGELHILPIGGMKERISFFDPESGFPIRGWWGHFRLHGPVELLQVALDCGLGSKNSTGWGCITKEESPEDEDHEREEGRQERHESNDNDLRNEYPDGRGKL